MSKTQKIDDIEGEDLDLPDWMDPSNGRMTPYSEDELDILVEGTLGGIRDTAAWISLVERVGEDEARQVLRTRLIMLDEIAERQPRH
jgi:hypothetical protein